MQIKITRKDSFSLLEILADNGNPASGQNPVDEQSELAPLEFPEASGTLLIISGMPATAQCACTAAYKGTFAAIALAVPRLGVALVVHSTTKAYPFGSSIPLG
jgi:hypothetical protein